MQELLSGQGTIADALKGMGGGVGTRSRTAEVRAVGGEHLPVALQLLLAARGAFVRE
jgi:hypothetical protein